MVNVPRKFLAFSLIILMIIMAACGSDEEQSTPEPSATSASEAQVTEEVAVTEDPAQTPDPGVLSSADVDNIPNLSADGNYLITVIDAFDNYDAGDVPGLNGDEKWVLVRMTINNQDVAPFTVTSAALRAVDIEGNTYIAEEPNAASQPTILNTEVPTGEPLTGFALYALPESAEIMSIEWCLDENCQTTLVAPVLTIEG